MAYRFILEVPLALHEEAKAVISNVEDAQVLVERFPRPLNPDDAVAQLSVAAHSLDIIDALYRWMAATGRTSGIYLEAYKGGRIDLGAYDAPSLRRLVQSDQYWYEHTIPRLHYVDAGLMESGARVAEVPYGSRLASGATAVVAETRVAIDGIDHIAIRVRDIAKAEAFYRDFFGMDVAYRALREDGRWQHLPPDYDWLEALKTGIEPEIVRLQNGPLALVLVNAGGGAVLHETRIAYISVSAPLETLNALRGRVLFANFALEEDSARAVRFVDPFGVTWQIVATS